MFLDINGSSTKTRVKIQHLSESKFASKNEHDKNNKKCTIVFPDRKERLKITKPKNKCNPNAYGLLRIMFMRRLTAVPQLNIVGVQLSVEG